MDKLRDSVPPRIYDTIERAGISTSKQILVMSYWDLKRLTYLRTDDLESLKNISAEISCPSSMTCDALLLEENAMGRVSIGCPQIDQLLKTGLRRGTITELYGESGAGKTQIGIQTAVHSWPNGCVYVCTEDLFPIKRFEQVKKYHPAYCQDTEFGKNIFVEHITETNELLACVRVRLPRLLSQSMISLIVIDSVAAPFRSDTTNYVRRAEELRELAVVLTSIAQAHNLAVLCINQVTSSFDGTDNVFPSLGLAWSNMVTTRLHLRKTSQLFDTKSLVFNNNSESSFQYVNVRELSVSFASDLPKSSVKFVIAPNGLVGTS